MTHYYTLLHPNISKQQPNTPTSQSVSVSEAGNIVEEKNMKTKKQLREKLKTMGVKKQFKPYREPESEAVLLLVRHSALITDGLLVGSEIDVYTAAIFRIWTCRKQKAKAYAQRYALPVRLLDGEVELLVPAILADEILPKFGAKVKRMLSPEVLEAARARMAFANKRLTPKNIG